MLKIFRPLLALIALVAATVTSLAAPQNAFVNRDWEFSIFLKEQDGDPVNVTGSTWTFNLRDQPGATPVLTGTPTVTSGTGGQLHVAFTDAQMTMIPGNYFAELVRTDTGNDVQATWEVVVAAEGQADAGDSSIIIQAGPDVAVEGGGPLEIDAINNIGVVNQASLPDGDYGDIIASGGGTTLTLDAVNARSDEQCLTWEASSSQFQWQSCGSGGGIADTDYGDITVSSGGTVWTIDPDSVALGTDTTGGYAGSATEGGPATSVANGDFGDISIAAGVWSVDPNSVTLGTDTVGGYAGSATEGGPASTVADGDFGDISITAGAWAIDADSIALGTDTTGVYVAQVADGTGIDGSCNTEACTYTPSLDLTEITSAVLGNGTTSSLQVGTLELGAATDTTLARSGAGDVTIEGNAIVRAGTAAGGDLTGTFPNPTVAANSIALGTDTTGNYVADVADGTGIDGTATGEGSTYTPSLDLTEISSAVLGNGTTSTLQLGTIELGAATDTTLARSSAGNVSIEGNVIVRAGSTAGGDLTGTYPSPTITTDAVALGTDTTGNYVANITGGVGNAVTGSAGEGWTPTVSFDFSDAGASPTLAANEARFTSVSGNIVFEGSTADTIETRLVVTDPTTSDKTFTIPNANSVAVQPFTCSGSDKISAISAAGVISCNVDAGGGGATLADGDYGDIVVSGTGTIMTIDLDAVALGTDTTGSYVATVADGTGIDGTCSSEACTYTPTLDLTELATATFGSGTFTALVFDAGATDPTFTMASNSVTVSNAATFSLGTSAAFTTGTVELGAASDTTISRVGAGDIAVEGNTVVRSGTSAGGDLTGTYPNPTVASNSVALGTDTTGNYQLDTAAGTGIAVTHTPAEGSTATVAFSYTDKGADVALGADECVFTSNATVAGNLVCEGDTANTIESRIAVTDPTTTDKVFTLPDANSYPIVDKDYGDITVSASGQTWAIDADSVVLGTDTTGNYVASVAEGAAIDVTGTPGEGWTATVAVDLTELNSATFGAGAFTTMVWDAGATDPTATFASNSVTWSNAATFSLGTAAALTTGTIELGAASDTTIARVGAGDISIEGNTVVRSGTTAGGDLTGTYPSPTVAANSVALGTDTTGNYMSDVTAGTGIATTHTPGEGSNATIAFSYTDKTGDVALGADECVFTSNATVPGNLVCEGDTANTIESRIAFTDPTTTDKVMTIPDANSNPVQPLTCGSTDKVSAISAAGVITCTADVSAGGGDSIRVEDSDNAGTFTAMSDADFDDSGDINFTRTAGPPDVITATVRADSVALGTDTTGNYVSTVADGTGIDGTCSSETCTYTPTLDLTELATATFGAGTFTTLVFDAGATDPTFTFASNSVTVSNAATFSLGTSAVFTTGSIELGAASDTTITRSAAGEVQIEGVDIIESGDSAGGDLTGTYPNPTITTNAVALTTDTTGNYVGTVAAGTGIAVTGADAENATKTVAFDYSDAGANPTLAADEGRFSSNATVGGYLVFEGDTADTSETRIAITDPTADRTFTIPNADSYPITDKDYGDITVSASGQTWNVDADSIALGTDTTGNYVGSVADGTGIDGTAAGEGATYTPTLDLTEINSVTWGDGSQATISITFNQSGATIGDPVLEASDGAFTFTGGIFSKLPGAANLGGQLAVMEDPDNGANFIAFRAPTTITSDVTCTLENDSNPIPDSCVGNGVDDTGAGGGDAVEVEQGDDAGTFDAIDSTARFDDSGDINFTFTDGGAGGPDTVTATVRADAVALGTDTTGVYVSQVADGTGIDGTCNSETCTYTPTLDLTELATATFGAGTFTTLAFDAGATDPTFTFASNSVTVSNAATFSLGTSAAFTAGTIELGAASDTTLARVSAGTVSIEGQNILTAATGQPLDSDLTSWAGVTRASGFDTFATTPTSANLRGLLTDEIGTGVLVFLGTPADDQVPVGDSASATTWRTLPDSDGATQKLQYDQATNTFSAGTDDDVPEVGDFAALVGGSGIDNNSGTLDLDLTEINSATFGSGTFTTLTFDAGATDPQFIFGSGTLTIEAVTSFRQADAANAGGQIRLLEDPGTGANFIAFAAPASITSDVTCTLENDANPIPDSCVGDGTDAGGSGAQISGTPVDNQVAVWTNATTIEGDTAFTFDTSTDALSVGTSGIFTVGTIELGAASDTTLARSSAGNVTIEGSVVKKAGTETIAIPAYAMVPNTTNGCASSSTETTTNKVMIQALACDASTDESAQFVVPMPKSVNESTVTFSVDWTASTGSGNVVWGMQCLARSDDDAIDTAFGTAVTVTDTLLATGDEHRTSTSSAVTPGGTWAENDVVWCRVYRDADNGSDTFSADALLIAVSVYVTTNAANDG